MNATLFSKYIGKHVILFPNDTYTKHRIITDVDDLGWQFTPCNESGQIIKGAKPTFYSINHHTLTFDFVD